MNDDIKDLYTSKAGLYDRFVSLFRYRHGLQAFWEKSGLLADGIGVLDAGCGSGMLSLAFLDALANRHFTSERMHAFDLTPKMIELFRARLAKRSIGNVEIEEANVLHLETLPETWTNYDLVISASMLEYVPRDRFVDAIRGLGECLKDDGTFVLFITRDNWLMRWLIGKLWHSNLYTRAQLHDSFGDAGFSDVRFDQFPLSRLGLRFWGHIVIATKASLPPNGN